MRRSHPNSLRVWPWICVALVSCLAPSALAGQVTLPSDHGVAATQSMSFDEVDAALDTDSLDRYRGGSDTVDNTVDIRGDVSDNTAQDIVTGNNIIDGGAFANSNGISTVIQNSGANVLIQNGMVINVQFANPGTP